VVTINNVIGFIVVLLVWYKIQIDMDTTINNELYRDMGDILYSVTLHRIMHVV